MTFKPLIDAQTPKHLIAATIRKQLALQEQSRKVMALLLAEPKPEAKCNLYWQLRQVNDSLGIPTESPEQLLGAAAPAVPVLQGGDQ